MIFLHHWFSYPRRNMSLSGIFQSHRSLLQNDLKWHWQLHGKKAKLRWLARFYYCLIFFFGFRLLLTKFKGTNYMWSIMVFTTQESVMPRPTNREFFTVQSCHPCKTRCVTCPFGAADKMFRVGKGRKDRKIIPRLNKETKTTVWSQGNSFTYI